MIGVPESKDVTALELKVESYKFKVVGFGQFKISFFTYDLFC